MSIIVIAGASPGLGTALAETFSRDAKVVALGRSRAIEAVAHAVPGVTPVTCELDDEGSVAAAFATIEKLGSPDVVFYNAHRIELRPVLETSPAAFTEAWRAGCFGAFLLARCVVPGMVARGRGTLVFTGATGSVRGGKRSAAFAAAKFALRGLSQSLAREFSPAGIHVAHVLVDGLVWSERSRARFGATEEHAIAPSALASTYRHLVEQPKSAWTHELDVRPYQEKFGC